MTSRYRQTILKAMSHKMPPEIRQYYLEYSAFTHPGLYEPLLRELPEDIREIGLLVRKNIIHRTTLALGNTSTNADLRFGDMTKVPWWRQPEDDIFETAAALFAELYRRDNRGLVYDRAVENKLVVTCRYVSLMMASILKAKGVPCRVRSGNAPYFIYENKISYDHWINEYWDDEQDRWVMIDVDGSLSMKPEIDPYDIPTSKFDFAAPSWLGIREGKLDAQKFYNAGGFRGAMVVAWSLFYDFHCLMNDECLYMHQPAWVRVGNFDKLTESQLSQIDDLARLMLDVEGNFTQLRHIWETNKDFRLLTGGLL